MVARQVLKYDRTIGIVAMEGRGFSNPVDIAFSSDDRIYVISRTNSLQPYGIRIGICDLESNYYGDFGSYGSEPGQFVWPTSVAFDSDDNLYLVRRAQPPHHRVRHVRQVHLALGRPRFGRWADRWPRPELRSIPSGTVLVGDAYNGRIQRFTGDGEFMSSFGRPGGDPAEFNMPWGVTLDSDGNVYVADWRNDRIQKFSPNGEFMAAFGESGDGDGQFQRPSSVAVDDEGLIYVADWGNERVQVLWPDGEFLEKLRGQATLSKWAEEFYAANSDEWQARQRANIMVTPGPDVETPYQESARVEPYFWGPISVKLDRQGRLYVTESNRHRIQVYEKL